jgi:hypothetical protein
VKDATRKNESVAPMRAAERTTAVISSGNASRIRIRKRTRAVSCKNVVRVAHDR